MHVDSYSPFGLRNMGGWGGGPKKRVSDSLDGKKRMRVKEKRQTFIGLYFLSLQISFIFGQKPQPPHP